MLLLCLASGLGILSHLLAYRGIKQCSANHPVCLFGQSISTHDPHRGLITPAGTVDLGRPCVGCTELVWVPPNGPNLGACLLRPQTTRRFKAPADYHPCRLVKHIPSSLFRWTTFVVVGGTIMWSKGFPSVAAFMAS